MFYPRFFRIYKRMKEKKVKAGYLAAFVGISPAVLSKKLNGRTPWRTRKTLSKSNANGL